MKSDTILLGKEAKTEAIVESDSDQKKNEVIEKQAALAKERATLTSDQSSSFDFSPRATFPPESVIKIKLENSENMKNHLFGEGVKILNWQVKGGITALGSFTNGTSSIGIEEGLVLSTGKVQQIGYYNSQTKMSSNNGGPSDQSIADMVGNVTKDAAVLEFDFIPEGDNLYFEYVFASEEYNQYVGAEFNDAFAYFLDGINVALLPGTNVPVSINTVNAGSNSEYYRNNDRYYDPKITEAEEINSAFDGLTKVLPVSQKLNIGQQYHMKIVIADVADAIKDSAVFIKAKSFTSSYKATYLPGEGGEGTVPDEGQAVLNKDYTLAQPTDLSRPGYVFGGWKSSADGIIYKAGAVVKQTADTTYTAQWLADAVTVTYDLGTGVQGTKPASATQNSGTTYTVASASGITKNGYTFAGWRSSVDNKLYQAGQTFTLSQAVTLSAEWTANPAPTHGTVTFVHRDAATEAVITPPAGVAINKSPDTQPINDSTSYIIPNLLPDYAFDGTGKKVTNGYGFDLNTMKFRVLITAAPIEATIYYKKQGKVNVKFVDEARNPIVPPVGTKTLLNGDLGATVSESIATITDYEFLTAEGAVLSGDKSTYSISNLTEADKTVTLVYKAVAKEVKMTVKYQMSGTTKDVIDLATKVKVPDVTKNVTIGQPISSYVDTYKIAIDGYQYVSATGNAGNVPDQDFEVVYNYEGKLSMESVSKDVVFGEVSNALISFGTKDIYPKDPIQVGILDTRDSGSPSWKLQLSVSEPMKTATNETLKGRLMFNQGGTNIPLTDVGQVIKTQGTKVVGRENLSWSSSGDKGLYIEQQPGNLKDVTYSGKVSWQLTDGL